MVQNEDRIFKILIMKVEIMYRIRNIFRYLDPTLCEKSLSLLQAVCQDE